MTEMVTAASQAAGAGAREAHPGFEVYDSEFAAALGPAPRLAQVREVMTVPLELASVSGPVRRTVRLDTNGLGPVRLTRPDVEVAADVGPPSNSSAKP